ncbi:MAG: hypothetical protein KAU14_06605 [Thermoplasmata archaeon]|nr:hypothetical protein [Thermoplasmata archaeon]
MSKTTDLEALGHKRGKVTERYTHVSDVNMRKFRNPSDTILQKGAEPNAKDKWMYVHPKVGIYAIPRTPVRKT